MGECLHSFSQCRIKLGLPRRKSDTDSLRVTNEWLKRVVTEGGPGDPQNSAAPGGCY